jgi:hypothetical protein
VALLEANRYASALSLARVLGMGCAFGQPTSAFHLAWLSRLPIHEQTNPVSPLWQ